jgi:diguanylate cyclase (GGDEF)-like protein
MDPYPQDYPLDPASSDVDGDARIQFWLTHMRIGFGVFLAETVVVMVYLAVTPYGPHRPTLWAVAGSWLVFASAGIWSAPMVVAKPWRTKYSVTWTMLSSGAVGIVAGLDGGTDSPVILLLFLPLVFAALMYTPRAAGLCGATSLLSAGTLTVMTTRAGPDLGDAVMLLAVLAGASVLSVAASINRTRMENHERLLMASIARLAATDELTGCAVRRVLIQRMAEEITRSMRNGQPLSLMMIDVDRFKAVNDTYGHLAGDQVLARVGSVLRSDARGSDLVCRLGGDEFALLLPDTWPSAAFDIAQRIRRNVFVTTEVAVTLSIGIGSLDALRPTVEQMFDDADRALYDVKRSNRDNIAIRHPAATPGAPSA